ncbi:MAG: hypothetical protein ACRC6F_04115, partial [Aeromonas sp.]
MMTRSSQILALACTKSNTLLWVNMANTLITKVDDPSMQLDHLPLPLSDWPLVLSDSPYWQ